MNIFFLRLLIAGITGIAVGLITQSVLIGAVVFVGLSVVVWSPIYRAYVQDNPQRFWFKRKLFGWGWTPVTWQGWASIIVYALLVGLSGLLINNNSSTQDVVLFFIVPTFVFTIILIYIAYRTGEKPKWQWGKDIDKYSK